MKERLVTVSMAALLLMVTLALITYFPELSLFLVKLWG